MLDHASLFRFEPIESEQLARAAFPLAHAARRTLTLTAWRRRIEKLRRRGAAGLESGHVAVMSARGAVLAIFAFVIEPPAAIARSGDTKRKLVINEWIACDLPGFDPQSVIASGLPRMAEICRCAEVMWRI